jgi:5-methylthioadenosine/S-adenosylhomocysteine deaminase
MKTQNTALTLFKGGAVITMDAEVPNLATGDVLVDGNRIAAVGANIQADGAEVIDASESIVMPGLIDAHHHMWLGVVRRMMPNVDDLTAYFDLIGRKMGLKYRPLDMHLSTKLTAVASLDAGITTIIDACHLSISPEHTDAALDALDEAGIRALHMAGAPLNDHASVTHLPQDVERLARKWNAEGGLVRVGLFGQINLDWWKVARGLDLRILTEFSGDWFQLGPEFAEKGVLRPHNIFNHCTRIPQETWKLFADAGVNVTVNPRSDALFGFDDEAFAYQQAIDHGLTPAIGIDLDTAFGSDMFGEMHALFGLQRSVMRGRRFRGEADAPAPITVQAVLKAATVHGARAAGLENSIGTLAPGKQADVIMVRTDGVGVFPVNNVIGTIVQAVGRADVDTVMVAGQLRKRAGKLIGVDLAKLRTEVDASRDYLLAVSGHRADLFGVAAPSKAGCVSRIATGARS